LRRAAFAAPFAALALSACGALKPGATLDQPVFSFAGIIAPESAHDVPPRAGVIDIGLLWIDPAQEGQGNWASGRELAASTIAPDGTFTVNLRGIPPAPAIRSLMAPGASAPLSFAFGEIVLFEDGNGDGRFDVGALADGSPMVGPDLYRGMPRMAVLIYVADPTPAGAASPAELADIVGVPGYHIGDINCGANTTSEEPNQPADPDGGAPKPPLVTLVLGPPSRTFPDLRACLRSHPTPPPSP
jgi:hypothetical protein